MSDSLKIAKRVAARVKVASTTLGRSKTAGEVRFIKDDGELKRFMPTDFDFNPKALKPLTKVAWSLSCAMGHCLSASQRLNKIKAGTISPDGRLGGKGYVMNISDMRKELSEAIETVSATIDTIHDEIKAPHWNPVRESLPSKDQKEIQEMLDDTEDILEDPEKFEESLYEKTVLDDIKDTKKKKKKKR